MILIKSQNDLELIKKAANIWKIVAKEIKKHICVGITTEQLNTIAKQTILANDAQPTFLHYNGFPKDICISVNAELLHGIPNQYRLKAGDLVTFDIGVTYQNRICDAAFSVVVSGGSNVSKQNEILHACQQCLAAAIAVAQPNNTVNDLSQAIEKTAHQYHFHPVHDFTGHGCGIRLHEDPFIPCHDTPHNKIKLIPGMTLCIEPMILTKSNAYFTKDNWVIIAKNGELTCHCEHMILITQDGNEILTNLD